MIVFPNAKINLGLNVIERRTDGYHNLETVFYPVNVFDALEIVPCHSSASSLTVVGKTVDCSPEDNLVFKAFRLLQADFDLPDIDIYMKKNIPMGAGLGGGSSDAAFMLKLLNDSYSLSLSESRLESYALRLGADAPFFIRNKPVLASGIGNIFEPVSLSLKGYDIMLVKPSTHISTAEAYAHITPHRWTIALRDIITRPVHEWKDLLHNDFEDSIFPGHPELAEIKATLYRAGAIYTSMSGSGSTVYGLFENKQAPASLKFSVDAEVFVCELE